MARGGATEQAAKTTFRDVFAAAEFRALWLAQLLSVIGDQLARVALSVLVYDRTRSALLAAVTFVASIVPTFVGGITLAWLADRHPRRGVMIVCDLARCALVLVMAIPGMPLAGMVALLFLVTLVGAPFLAARAAIMPDMLAGDRYVAGTAVTLTTFQFAQVIGFAAGGTLVGFFGTRISLVIDGATFAASALILRGWVRSRPVPGTLARRGSERSRLSGIIAGTRLVFANRILRTTRFVAPSARLRYMGPLAVATSAVLVLFIWRPGLLLSLLILFASGLCASYQLAANAAFVRAAPQERRSQAFGLAQGGMSLGQGIVLILAGAAADHHSPALVISVCGAIGAMLALVIALTWLRDRGPDGRTS